MWLKKNDNVYQIIYRGLIHTCPFKDKYGLAFKTWIWIRTNENF